MTKNLNMPSLEKRAMIQETSLRIRCLVYGRSTSSAGHKLVKVND